MAAFFQRKSVRVFLTVFKWCRVTVLMAILLVVAFLTYLQLIGLPDLLKGPLLNALRQRGFDAQFASARLGWGPAIIIENAAFSPTNQATGPRLTAGMTMLELNSAALLRTRLRVDSFEVLQAGLRIPVSPTNQPPLSLSGVNLHVDLLSNHVARLSEGSAWFRGIRIHLNGEIRNVMLMRDWKIPLPSPATNEISGPSPSVQGPAPKGPTLWERLQQVRFTGTPELNMHLSGDGMDRNSLKAELEFTSKGAQTPWGESGPFHIQAACARLLNSGRAPFFQARFQAREIATPWGTSGNLTASLDFAHEAGTNLSIFAHLSSHDAATTRQPNTGSNWVRVGDLHWEGNTVMPSPTFKPASFKGTLRLSQIESGWGSAASLSLDLQSRRLEASAPDPALGIWNKARSFSLDWQAVATNVVGPQLELERLAFAGAWQPSHLSINKLEAYMYHGHLGLDGNLDVASREVQAHVSVGFDPHQIASLLTPDARHWISSYDWETPPNLEASLRFVLPAWTNPWSAWPEASRNSVQLAGDFSLGRGAFQGIAVNSAKSHFAYTNRIWNVSNLQVASAGGLANLDYLWNDLTHDYHFRFDSKLDPSAVLPLLTKSEQQMTSQFSFSTRPVIKGEVWGNWSAPETTGFLASLETGRFKVRGETVNQLTAQVGFTNYFLRITNLTLTHDTGRVDIPLAGIDFSSNIISMSNASSSMDPEPVRRALGKIAPPFMKVIHFDTPPHVMATGHFTPGNDDGTDMRFFVEGDHFHWNGLNVDSIQGKVDYHVRTVVVTNVHAGLFKTGKLDGGIDFEWEQRGTRFDSDLNLRDFDLGAVARDLTYKGSKIEGMLNGHLALAAPYDASDTNLFGRGWFNVHNALLWDIKIFGVFSPVLNAIAPGAGNSRARDASASFTMTNGVLTTDDLEIRSSGFRLLYHGTVDTKRRLNAKVEANLLRDTPLFGHFLSFMLTPVDKMFEYRVTGTIDKPVAKPEYIPKLFLDLLRPFHSLKEMMPSPEKPAAKPPATTPKP